MSIISVVNRDLGDDHLARVRECMNTYGINNLKCIEWVLKCFSKNDGIEKESNSLASNTITSNGVSGLLDTLKECNSVVSKLDLSCNQLDDECMQQLGEYIQNNENVEVLRLDRNKITDKGAEILSEYLIGNTKLRKLCMAGNLGITDRSVPHLIEMINKSCIATLNVDYTSASEEKQQEIKEALKIQIEQREISVKSDIKSAAKISASTWADSRDSESR